LATLKRALFHVLQEGGWKLSRDQEVLSKEVPSSLISTANMEIAAVIQPSAAGTKVVRGTYLKISAEKKAEIGQHAAAMVQYYAKKLLVPLVDMVIVHAPTSHHLQLVDKLAKSITRVYVQPARNSLIVGMAYLSSTFVNYFNDVFKNSYS